MTEITMGTLVADRYKVQCLIGTGGMANVFRAWDTYERRDVAIKVLKSEYSEDAEFLRRFNSEAAAVLNLSHPSIVSSYDVGQWEDNHYIVLEYVPGCTLKEKIRAEAPFTNKRLISVGCQLCDALSHAHQNNIIHRDVKPQNVIISGMGRVKMADFGIARFADASTVTYTGDNVLGSVHYVSPEQARGSKVDEKTDIYSLGIVLYEMATGRVPFDAESTVSVAIKHLQEEMIPPIELNPEMGTALNAIILKATAKDPAARHSTMAELRRDLLRASREPDGDFVTAEVTRPEPEPAVRLRKTAAEENKSASPMRRTMLLGLIVLIVVGLLTSFVMIGSALLNKSDKGEVCYVPAITGKTMAEAEASAQSMGFTVKIRNEVVSGEFAAGTVIEQEPKAGNKGYEGDVIYVDVSTGPATLEAPNLLGITVEEATDAADQWGLAIDGVVFEQDEYAEPGKVFRQYPEAGTPVFPGDGITLYVNSVQEDRSIVPATEGSTLADAVNRLRGAGFVNVFVREAEGEGAPGTVASQLPAQGELKSEDTVVELWVYPTGDSSGRADVAFNISVEENDSTVMVLRHADNVHYVLFESVMQAGAQTVSLTVRAPGEGPHDLIVTVNGKEVRRESVTLTENSEVIEE